MINEVRGEYDTEFAAITAVAKRLGIGSAETLRKWVRLAEAGAGQRPGTLSGLPWKFVGVSCGLWYRFVLRGLFLLVVAYAVHQVVQVCCGEFPAERPGGLVVAVHEAQQRGGEFAEAGEVVGGDDFLLDDGEEDLVG
jgi:hypothetical protein